MRVHFSGGATTARGRVPATYSTADPVKQAIIEKSNYFKTGHIFVVQSMEVPDDAAAKARKAREAARAEAAREAFNANREATTEENVESPEELVEEPATEENGEVPEAITVSSLDDAKDYLNEHFGIAKSQLRSRSAIEERAKEHGVVFFFKNA